MTEEGDNLPNLIVIDGGKGQLSSSVKGIETSISIKQMNIC